MINNRRFFLRVSCIAVLQFVFFFAAIADAEELTIVAFGDSTTAVRNSINQVYADRLPALLAAKGIDAQVINSGVGGSHTGRLEDNALHDRRHALDRFQDAVRDHNPDIVIIQFGWNDSYVDEGGVEGKSRIPLDAYKKNLLYMVETLRGDGAHVILMTPNRPRSDFEAWRFERTEHYVEAVQTLASETGVALVDVWDAYAKYAAEAGHSVDDLLLDNVHPNDAGHALVAQLLTDSIVAAGIAQNALAAPFFQMTPIFLPQAKHVHSSSIVECPNGDLLVCWFHGSGERTADDVVIQGARKKMGENSWSPVFLMADTQGFPDCNPVLFIDEQERLWLFWAAVVANGWQHSLLKYRRAENYQGDGPPAWSWQDVITLKPGEGFPEAIKQGFDQLEAEEGCWGEYALPYEECLVEAARDKVKRQKGWMTRIHPTVLPGGRILLPLYSDGFNLSLIGISDDLGETWTASGPIVGYGPTQPSIVRKKDGVLVAYLRDEGNDPKRVQISTSGDNGKTWSPSVDLDIPNPSSSLEALVLKDGRWLMLCNDTEQSRNRLVLLVSDDEGATWKWKRQVEPSDDAGKSFEYPSIIQSRDGLIHMSYTRKTDEGNTIAHCTVNVDWIDVGN